MGAVAGGSHGNTDTSSPALSVDRSVIQAGVQHAPATDRI